MLAIAPTKRLLGAAAALTLVAALGACGSGDDERRAALPESGEVVTTPGTATEQGKPSAPPDAPPDADSYAPAGDPPAPAEPVRPDRPAAPQGRIVQLLKRRIPVPLRCRASGQVSLRTPGLALGGASFDCSDFRGVATVVVAPGAARELVQRLAKRRRLPPRRRALPLVARISAGGEVLSARLRLGAVQPQGAGKAAGLYWTTGYLSCGRPNNLSQPGLRAYSPTVSSAGQRSDLGFYNATGQNNWVNTLSWLYTYGVGWQSYGWAGWIYVPPYTTITIATGEGRFLANPPQGRYVGGATWLYWWNGFRDWNYLYSSTPDFGYPTYGSFYCHIV